MINIDISKIYSVELINEIKGYSIVKRLSYIAYIFDYYIEVENSVDQEKLKRNLFLNFKLEINILNIKPSFFFAELKKLLNKEQFYTVVESDFIDFKEIDGYEIFYDMYEKYSRQLKIKKILL